MAPAKCLPFSLLFLVTILCAITVKSLPLVNHGFDQSLELTHDERESIAAAAIHYKEPPPAFIFDDDLVRFVQCFYDPLTTGCDGTRNESVTVAAPTESAEGHISQESSSEEDIAGLYEIKDDCNHDYNYENDFNYMS